MRFFTNVNIIFDEKSIVEMFTSDKTWIELKHMS